MMQEISSPTPLTLTFLCGLARGRGRPLWFSCARHVHNQIVLRPQFPCTIDLLGRPSAPILLSLTPPPLSPFLLVPSASCSLPPACNIKCILIGLQWRFNKRGTWLTCPSRFALRVCKHVPSNLCCHTVQIATPVALAASGAWGSKPHGTNDAGGCGGRLRAGSMKPHGKNGAAGRFGDR